MELPQPQPQPLPTHPTRHADRVPSHRWMGEQLSLPGLDATAPPFRPDALRARRGALQGYSLFLAIFPESQDALRIAQVRAQQCRKHRLAGTSLSPERLHITLHGIAGFVNTIPRSVVDAALAAAARVACPPLSIVFDHVQSFPESDAFVLRCHASSDAAVARLRQSLTPALRRMGLRSEPSRTPHMTMLYDKHHIDPHPIQPICWTATRFALILSHVGQGHHQWIEQWALTG